MTSSKNKTTDTPGAPHKVEILIPPFNPSGIHTFALFLLAIGVTSVTYHLVNKVYIGHVKNTLGMTAEYTLPGQPVWTQQISQICEAPIPEGHFVAKDKPSRPAGPDNSKPALNALGHGACVVDRFRHRLGLTANTNAIVDGSETAYCNDDMDNKEVAADSATRWAALCGNIAYLTKMHSERDIWLLRHPGIKARDQLEHADFFEKAPETSDPSCKPSNGEPYRWFTEKCLLQRLTGLEDETSFFGVKKTAREASPRGVVYDWSDVRIRPSDNIDHRRQLSVLRAFDKAIETSWDSILEDKRIRPWRLIVRVLNGYPQYLIVLAGVFATFLLFARLAIASQQRRGIRKRKGNLYKSFKNHCAKIAEETGERVTSSIKLSVEQTFNRFLSTGSSTTVDWLISIIPLLGFVGTVYGMILALGTINTVVSAEPGPELDSAMSQIGGDLSLAFTTTLLALLFTIYLIFLREAVRSAEMKLVATLPTIDEGAE